MISVAVVTYNGEKYIGEQLDSILSNLGPEDEVVVSDDDSRDNTVHLLEEYEKRDARIRCIRGPGRGIIPNVEHVLRHCRGEYIFLSDQDDVWRPDKTDRVLEVFEKQNAMLVMHDARVMDGSCRQVLMPSFFAYRHSRKGAVKNIIKISYMGCCMAFRREVLDEVLPIPVDIQMHDQWIGVKCDLRYHKTVLLEKPLLCYRRHEENASDFSHNSVPVMVKNRLTFIKRLLK